MTKKPGQRTLRAKIALSVAGTVTALLLVAAVAFTHYNYRLLVEDIESEARRSLVVLSAVHTQSMLERTTERDGDPAIAVLNGTFAYLGKHDQDVDPWMVMGPKVVAYQRQRGAAELELPRDDIDRRAIASGQAVSDLTADGIYRRTQPVILGEGPASNPRCAECHAIKMGIAPGEVIGAMSVAIDARTRWSAFGDSAKITIAVAVGIAALISWLSARLVDGLAGEPLSKMTTVMSKLAQGNLEVEIPSQDRADEVGAMAQALTVFRDNALKHRAAEHTLRLLSQATEQSTSAVVITDANNAIVYVNPTFTSIMGYPPEEVIGQNPSLFSSGQTAPSTYDDLWRHIRNGQPWRGEILDRKKDGSSIWIGTTIAPVVDKEGQATHFVAVYHDVTERKAAEDRLAYLAYHDTLTDLPNRNLFNDRLLMALAAAERSHKQVAVLLLDIDDFASINDTLGHAAGDVLIRAVAERLRDADTLSLYYASPARVGGDEFAIILNEVAGEEGVAAVATRLLRLFNEPFVAGLHEVRAKASMGIALFPEHGNKSTDLLRRADLALHAAKLDARCSYLFFRESMESAAVKRADMEHELANAMGKRQLWLAYQPQIDPRTNRLCGLEALLRWTHPERGAISPAVFIPVAESNRLIVNIGRWVIEETCRQMATWRDEGFELVPVAVNLSPLQVSEPTLTAHITAAVETYGIAPELLALEITESAFLQHSESVSQMMHDLMERGHRFVLDDFGTGYSSLSYLSRYPFDKIKLDRAFISNIHESPGNAAIVRATVSLGHELGMRVTAEGVEKHEELRMVMASDIDEIQGYYYSKPLRPEEVPGFVAIAET